MNLVMPLSRKELMPLWSLYQLYVHILGGYFLICKMEIMRQVTVTFINTKSTIFPNLKPFNSSPFYFCCIAEIFILEGVEIDSYYVAPTGLELTM